MVSWIKRAGAILWQTLETASGGGSGAAFDYYNARLSRLESLEPGELEAYFSPRSRGLVQ
jgi:hypothetical protein